MSALAERLSAVQSAIAAAAAKSGRGAAEITLVAVSKSHPPETVLEAVDAGQLLFGESRVQEARAKIPLLPSRARWHFIGHLQRNKVRQALTAFELFHGIDSADLAREFDRQAAEVGIFPRALLEVNLAGEGSKFGFTRKQLREQIEELLALERLEIEGLMCIPPPSPKPEDTRRYFVALRELRDELQGAFSVRLPQLSMGMSSDYPVAVEEGATLVRVGTAIFGPRTGKTWKPAAGAEFGD
jgi:pyridoxal phosphate enzyme (YggS family)